MDFLNTIKPLVTVLLKSQPAELPDMFEWVTENKVIGMKPFNEDGSLNELIIESLKVRDEVNEDVKEALLLLLSEYQPKHLFTAGMKSDGNIWMTGIGIKCKDKTPVVTFGNERFPYAFMNMTRSVFTSRDGQEFIKLWDTRHNGYQLPVRIKKGVGQPSLKAIKAEPWLFIEPVSSGSSFNSTKSYHAMIEQGKVYTGSVDYTQNEPFIHVETCDGSPCDFNIKIPAKNAGMVSRLVSHITFQIDPTDERFGYTKDGNTYMCWSKPLDIMEVKISKIKGLHNL